MVWTKNTPQRFIDERQAIEALRAVCHERMAACDADKRWTDSAETVEAELARLAPVAALVALEGQPVNGCLFQPETVELIKAKSGNRYWLWFLLSKLETSTFPVDPLSVARAHARAKAALWDNRFGFGFVAPISLIYELKALPPGFAFEMWDDGRVLADRRKDANGYSLRLNPLLIDD